MNTLSWFLYLADVAGGINLVLLLASVGGLVFLPLVTAFRFGEGLKPAWTPTNTKYAIAIAAALFFVVILPSKSTMYAIAASELGQQAVESKLGQKVATALEQWIDQQIAGVKK